MKEGDVVRVHYEGKLDDGQVFDSSNGGAPLEFLVGGRYVIPGFETAVVGMEVGEEKSISIPPEQAYGPKVAELIHSVPRADLPTDEKLEPGMMFMVEMEDGMEVPVTISAVEEDKVTLDFNPPLAGQTLHFTIKMVEYFKAPEDYQPPGCGCGCGDHDDECCGGHGEDCGCDDEECDCGEGEDCKCGEKDCDCK